MESLLEVLSSGELTTLRLRALFESRATADTKRAALRSTGTILKTRVFSKTSSLLPLTTLTAV